MSSYLRPQLADGDGKAYCPTGGTAYLMILNSVKAQPGLIHGQLHNPRGEHCAIGSFFENNRATLNYALIDEVAAVNDSAPTATKKQRRLIVMRWLRWKLAQVGMPGFIAAKQP